MNWGKLFEIVGSALPAVGEFVGYIVGLSDEEWEEISKAWPSPTKTKMARLRAEVKAHAHFFGED